MINKVNLHSQDQHNMDLIYTDRKSILQILLTLQQALGSFALSRTPNGLHVFFRKYGDLYTKTRNSRKHE